MPTLNTWKYKNCILEYLYTSFIIIHKYITLNWLYHKLVSIWAHYPTFTKSIDLHDECLFETNISHCWNGHKLNRHIYYIILMEKSHWVLGCYQTQKLPACRSIQLLSKTMFKISGFFSKKINHINLIVKVKSIGGLIGDKWHN